MNLSVIQSHLDRLRRCRECENMVGPVVTPRPLVSKVYLIGQAPGPREGALGRPFAWTAGKTLFRWFESVGMDEERVRSRVYLAAVCRCFPGKTKQGGDRVPDRREIENCSQWMRHEIENLQPVLVIPVGRLAIEQVVPSPWPKAPLAEVIGKTWATELGAAGMRNTRTAGDLRWPSGTCSLAAPGTEGERQLFGRAGVMSRARRVWFPWGGGERLHLDSADVIRIWFSVKPNVRDPVRKRDLR